MKHFEIDSIEYRILSFILLKMKRGKALIDLDELRERFDLDREQLVNILRKLEERGLIKVLYEERDSLISQIEKYISILDDVDNRRETPDSKPILLLRRKYKSLLMSYERLVAEADLITKILRENEKVEKRTIEKLISINTSLYLKDVSELNLELSTYRSNLIEILENVGKKIDKMLTLKEIFKLVESIRVSKDLQKAFKLKVIKTAALRTIHTIEYLTLVSYPLIGPLVHKKDITDCVKTLDLRLKKTYIYVPSIEKADNFMKNVFGDNFQNIEKLFEQNILLGKKLLPVLVALKFDYILYKNIIDTFKRIL